MTALQTARRAAGLSQRELAHRTGVAQPTIARIERGQVDPRVGTLERLLAACQTSLRAEQELGIGIDRTQFVELLKLTPDERLDRLVADVRWLAMLDEAVVA